MTPPPPHHHPPPLLPPSTQTTQLYPLSAVAVAAAAAVLYPMWCRWEQTLSYGKIRSRTSWRCSLALVALPLEPPQEGAVAQEEREEAAALVLVLVLVRAGVRAGVAAAAPLIGRISGSKTWRAMRGMVSSTLYLMSSHAR